MKIFFLMLSICFLLAGCNSSETKDKNKVTPQEQAQRESVYWQMEKPRIQLDPVEEKEYPTVIVPKSEEEK